MTDKWLGFRQALWFHEHKWESLPTHDLNFFLTPEHQQQKKVVTFFINLWDTKWDGNKIRPDHLTRHYWIHIDSNISKTPSLDLKLFLQIHTGHAWACYPLAPVRPRMKLLFIKKPSVSSQTHSHTRLNTPISRSPTLLHVCPSLIYRWLMTGIEERTIGIFWDKTIYW